MKRPFSVIIVLVAVVGGTTHFISRVSISSVCYTYDQPLLMSHGMWCRMVLHVSIYCICVRYMCLG